MTNSSITGLIVAVILAMLAIACGVAWVLIFRRLRRETVERGTPYEVTTRRRVVLALAAVLLFVLSWMILNFR